LVKIIIKIVYLIIVANFVNFSHVFFDILLNPGKKLGYNI